jgi:hypothetical protein
MKYSLSLAVVVVMLGCLRFCRADETSPTEDPNLPLTVELTVKPAPEPRPALKYRLLAVPSERTPGNAATYYYRALLHLTNMPQSHWKEYDDRSAAWLSTDRQTYPKEEVARWLQVYQHAPLHNLRIAANREYCDWDFRIQDLRGMETIGFLLREVQDMRSLARVVQIKAHHEIMEGQYEDALQTLRLGYQMAHDVAREPLLINALVGVAIAQMMNHELLALIEHSDVNCYWAVASLPQPLIALRPALQYEMHMPYQLFPFLKDAATVERTPEEWRRTVVEFIQAIPLMESGAPSGIPTKGWEGELVAALMVAKIYPVSKDALIAGGMDRDEVEAMPVGQVVAIHTAKSVEYAYQEVFKVALLPYDEASRRMPAVMERLSEEGLLRSDAMSGRGGLPIAGILLPAVSNVLHAEVRMGRNRAAIQAIEAIRMHAAVADNLPASLDEISVVPVPHNPATGEPFPYSFDAATEAATLEVPALGGQQPRQDGKRYVIRLEK